MSNAVRTIESCFRETLGLNGDEPGGILPMGAPTQEEEEPELVTAALA